jgi:hypothetical protein
MKGNHQTPIPRNTVVILSEAKDLGFFFWLPAGRPEVFRFAQRDSMELVAWSRASSFSGCWNLEVGD